MHLQYWLVIMLAFSDIYSMHKESIIPNDVFNAVAVYDKDLVISWVENNPSLIAVYKKQGSNLLEYIYRLQFGQSQRVFFPTRTQREMLDFFTWFVSIQMPDAVKIKYVLDVTAQCKQLSTIENRYRIENVLWALLSIKDSHEEQFHEVIESMKGYVSPGMCELFFEHRIVNPDSYLAYGMAMWMIKYWLQKSGKEQHQFAFEQKVKTTFVVASLNDDFSELIKNSGFDAIARCLSWDVLFLAMKVESGAFRCFLREIMKNFNREKAALLLNNFSQALLMYEKLVPRGRSKLLSLKSVVEAAHRYDYMKNTQQLTDVFLNFKSA